MGILPMLSVSREFDGYSDRINQSEALFPRMCRKERCALDSLSAVPADAPLFKTLKSGSIIG